MSGLFGSLWGKKKESTDAAPDAHVSPSEYLVAHTWQENEKFGVTLRPSDENSDTPQGCIVSKIADPELCLRIPRNATLQTINDADVTALSMDEIGAVVKVSTRPMTLTFKSLDMPIAVAREKLKKILSELSDEDARGFLSWCQKLELLQKDGSFKPDSEMRPRPWPLRERPENTNVHEYTYCDKSGAGPIVGYRWKKINEDYDLCDSEYQKLALEEQEEYVCMPGGPPSITILNPSAGVQWPTGSTQEIQWETTGSISAVSIKYAPTGSWFAGWSYLVLGDDTNIPNTGRCSWQPDLEPGTKITFRITSTQYYDAKQVHADSEPIDIVAAKVESE